jgi:hypothetical protein
MILVHRRRVVEETIHGGLLSYRLIRARGKFAPANASHLRPGLRLGQSYRNPIIILVIRKASEQDVDDVGGHVYKEEWRSSRMVSYTALGRPRESREKVL